MSADPNDPRHDETSRHGRGASAYPGTHRTGDGLRRADGDGGRGLRRPPAADSGEARYRMLFDSIDQGFCVIQMLFDADDRPLDYVFLEVNAAFERQTKLRDAVGQRMRDLAPAHEEYWFETYGRIARTRLPERFERPADALGFYYEVFAFPVGEPEDATVGILFNDISARRRAEAMLRASEERQAFLLRLNDRLRPLMDPALIQTVASRLLVQQLGANRALYVEIEGEGEAAVAVIRGQHAEGVPTFPARVPYADYIRGFPVDLVSRHPTLVVNDTATDPRLDEALRQTWLRTGIAAVVGVSLVKDGGQVASFGLHSARPRDWTEAEIRLVEDVAERTWAAAGRARSEEALQRREAELARVQRIGQVGGLDIDLQNNMLGYRSPEYLRLHGLPPDRRTEPHGDWLARVHPDDRAEAERALFDSLNGRGSTYESEYRIIRPSNGETRWIHARADIERDAEGRAVRLVGAHLDITEQKHMQAAIRDSEARQAFLLTLSDALRPLADPLAIHEVACRMTAEHLDIGRVTYGEVRHEPEAVAVIERDWPRRGMPPAIGRFRIADFGRFQAETLNAGHPAIIADATSDPRVSPTALAAWRAMDIIASCALPVMKEGRLVACLVAQDNRPHNWTDSEISLLQDVSERTWTAVERARIDAALRDSEEQLRSFGEASSDVLWVRDAETLAWTYLSPAFERIYGLSRERALDGDTVANWLEMILPEDRERAMAQIARVRAGERVTSDYRVRRRPDGEIRHLRTTDFPIRAADGRVVQIGGVAHDATDEREVAERQAVLVGELQHRTRNMMGVIRTLAEQALRSSRDLDEFRARFLARLAALTRANALLSRLDVGRKVTFAELIGAELDALGVGEDERGKVTLSGPDAVPLRSSGVQILGMAIHELATNALKYGALQQPEGRLSVRWDLETDAEGRRWLHIDWRETGVRIAAGATETEGGGAGRLLIERALPYQLGARTTFSLMPDGVHCTIALRTATEA